MKKLILVGLLIGASSLMAIENFIPSFSDFDTDRDGRITQEEFTQTQAKRMKEHAESGRMMRNVDNAPNFRDVDTDKNGTLDPIEFSNHQRAHRAANRNK